MPKVLNQDQLCQAWYYSRGWTVIQRVEYRKSKTGKTFDLFGCDFLLMRPDESPTLVQVTSFAHQGNRRVKLRGIEEFRCWIGYPEEFSPARPAGHLLLAELTVVQGDSTERYRFRQELAYVVPGGTIGFSEWEDVVVDGTTVHAWYRGYQKQSRLRLGRNQTAEKSPRSGKRGRG
jgi:hypothetical protein